MMRKSQCKYTKNVEVYSKTDSLFTSVIHILDKTSKRNMILYLLYGTVLFLSSQAKYADPLSRAKMNNMIIDLYTVS